MSIRENVSLDDKYTLSQEQVFLTGVQALVRLPLMQRQRDLANGLNTGCYISGYRGSPLGGLDKALWSAQKFIQENNIHFQPGLNEDLAATAVWGSQQVNLFPDATVDGVFSMWYGKGPGVDRSGDVFKHGNAAGSARHGGVLVIAGDDHTCKSSTLPHQSEYAFIDASIPVLNPSGVQEILDMGIFGWELSRFSGCWVGFKTVAEIIDSSASVSVAADRVQIVTPEDFELPAGGLNIRWPDAPLDQEQRLHSYKLYAAIAFARANRLNRVVVDSATPRFGIITTGKSYLDVRQAFDDLGIDKQQIADIGIRLLKVGMSWPLDKEMVRQFAEGLLEVLVVEEKRPVIENQLKEQLYNWRSDIRPRVVGKFDEQHDWILPSAGELSPARIARVIAARIARFYTSEYIEQRLAFLDAKERALENNTTQLQRVPHFCSGCPHNTSTNVPDGSRALAGIGCHYMALWMDRSTETFTQMGGEGVPWMGQAPFCKTRHVFANLGDGTYFHSGLLAIRASIAAGVNITYKLLYNDAVAMTGGQPVDQNISVDQISHQLYGEGVRRIAVVSDEPTKYPDRSRFATGTTFHHRDDLNTLQQALRELEGTTVLIYDQTCATELRRRRKRGLIEDPDKRVVINSLVCEGCGDCGVKSNCLSIIPLETEFGRKRAIDQSACNKDFSCIKGFCPSFVTVVGGKFKQVARANSGLDGGHIFPVLPDPKLPEIDEPYGIVVTGIGGTGVVTIGALLGMAAHIEGKGVSVLDMTGLAQKYGSVVSHVRIARNAKSIHAVRVAAGNARLLLGCDAVVAAGFDALSKVERGQTVAVINSHNSPTSQFIHNPDIVFPQASIENSIIKASGGNNTHFVDATFTATQLLGDAIGSNLFMVGYAYQLGLIPLSEEAIEQAIELNGMAVEFNKKAFLWGRRTAYDKKRVNNLLPDTSDTNNEQTLADLVEVRLAFLVEYQDQAYADRYKRLVEKVQETDSLIVGGGGELSKSVAQNYFKLMAYKDEYEVARLYAGESFKQELSKQFEGDYKLRFHLAPPLLSRKNTATGEIKKYQFGGWLLSMFRLLTKLKFLRGSVFDIFGHTRERRQERELISKYENSISALLVDLDKDNYAVAVDIANLPQQIRGFGYVKEASIEKALAKQEELVTTFQQATGQRSAA